MLNQLRIQYVELDFELLVAQADQTFEAVPDSQCPSVPAGATTFFGPKISNLLNKLKYMLAGARFADPGLQSRRITLPYKFEQKWLRNRPKRDAET